MLRFSLTAMLLAGMSSAALAQGVSPSGAVHGQNWQMGQDLERARNPTAAPLGTAPDRARRVEQQRRQNQPITGTGRPVAAVPAPTPAPTPARVTAPQAARPPARPTPPRPPAEPASIAPSLRAAPVAIPSGQSTGAARGTPASR